MKKKYKYYLVWAFWPEMYRCSSIVQTFTNLKDARNAFHWEVYLTSFDYVRFNRIDFEYFHYYVVALLRSDGENFIEVCRSGGRSLPRFKYNGFPKSTFPVDFHFRSRSRQ